MSMKQSSIEFELDGLADTTSQPKLLLQEADSYREVDTISDSNGQAIMHLQKTLKAQWLILSHEETRKSDATKLIDCSARKALERWLAFQQAQQSPMQPRLLLTDKDLQDIQGNLNIQLSKMMRQLLTTEDMIKLIRESQDLPDYLLEDLSNFYPDYEKLLNMLVIEETQSPGIRLETLFEKGSPASKLIDSIHKRYECRIFCQGLLERGLNRLCQIKQQLTIDFGNEYERIKEFIMDKEQLPIWTYGNSKMPMVEATLLNQLHELFGQPKEILKQQLQQIEKAIEDTSAKKKLISEYKNQLEAQQDFVNVKIGLLTTSSIANNRKTIQNIVRILLQDIIASIDAFPQFIRRLAAVYQQQLVKCFPEYNNIEEYKSFFIKTVFSKWIFTEFMRSYHERGPTSSQTKNINFSVVCLILQKVLYGQQVTERQAYGSFNPLVKQYGQQVHQFIEQFKMPPLANEQIRENRVILFMCSLESVRWLINSLKNNAQLSPMYSGYQYLQTFLSKSYQMGNLIYPPKRLFIQYLEILSISLTKVFLPKDKLKRLLIQLLLAVPEIYEPLSLHSLLERHKYGSEAGWASKIPVELYANYMLSTIGEDVKIEEIVDKILEELTQTKKQQKIVKVLLETTKHYYDNLDKVLLQLATKLRSFAMIKEIDGWLKQLRIRGKLVYKAGEFVKYDREVKDPEHISEFIRKISQVFTKQPTLSTKEAYNSWLQDILEQSQKQFAQFKDNRKDLEAKIRDRVGILLSKELKLEQIISQKDQELLKQLKRLDRFVTMRHLEPKYELQEPLFVQLCSHIPQKLRQSMSPEGLLKLFNSTTNTFQQVILATGKASDITADIQIPLMQLMLIRCQPQNMHTLLRFVDGFMLEETIGTQLGQTLSLMYGSIVLVEHMTAQKLGMPEEEFEKYMKSE